MTEKENILKDEILLNTGKPYIISRPLKYIY